MNASLFYFPVRGAIIHSFVPWRDGFPAAVRTMARTGIYTTRRVRAKLGLLAALSGIPFSCAASDYSFYRAVERRAAAWREKREMDGKNMRGG